MEAKDGSMGFDFEGTYTKIVPHELIEYKLDDGRLVSINFSQENDEVVLTETFEAGDEHTTEQQKDG